MNIVDTTNTHNLILATDSYKINHWNQYPKNTEVVYSYFESREGAKWPYTVFFGLQYILKEFLAKPISWQDIDEALAVTTPHFANKAFNYQGWSDIKSEFGGNLPIRIKAVPEGTPVPTGNVLMTVENTDPRFYWLTNAIESLLTHVWYPSTVATLSRTTKEMQKSMLDLTSDSDAGLPFMLHDFGYRGVSSHESAGIGGLAHLVNYVGTDTLPAMQFGHKYYGADYDGLAYSVPATEHSVMTSLGEDGELPIVRRLIEDYPTGVLSVVADSYDIYRHVGWLTFNLQKEIMQRDGVYVVRPDSVTEDHSTPEDLVLWIAKELAFSFGYEKNSKGYKVIDPHIRILWGDGIDPGGIFKILDKLAQNGFAAENMATFGMGGGLLQKVNRDTQRFAFKSSAQKRDGAWHDVFKVTPGKSSKKGRLQLSRFLDYDGVPSYMTLAKGQRVGHTLEYLGPNDQRGAKRDILETVFENGKIVKEYTFDEVRANAAI